MGRRRAAADLVLHARRAAAGSRTRGCGGASEWSSASGRWARISWSADSTPASSCRRSSRGSCRLSPTRGCRGARWSVVFMALAVLVAAGWRARPRLRRPAIQWLLIALVAFEYLGCADSPDAARSARGLSGARRSTAGGGVRGAVRHRRRVERRLRFAGSPHPLLRHPARSIRWSAATSGGCRRARRNESKRMEVAGPLLELSSSPAAGVTRPAAIATNAGEPCRYLVVHRAASARPQLLTYVRAAGGGANRLRRVARPVSDFAISRVASRAKAVSRSRTELDAVCALHRSAI